MAAVVLCAAVSGCGKKGPPLAPIVHVPAAVDKLTAQRIGNDIYLTVTIPTQNIDMSTPADVSRIDIFGVTTHDPPPRARFFEIATRVASIDVQPVAKPGEPAADAAASPLPAQGATVTVRDSLTPADLVPQELPALPVRGSGPATPLPPSPRSSSIPRRSYIAVAVSDRGRTGPPGVLLDVPLPPLPDPPAGLTSSYTEDAVTIAWEPAGGMVGFLLEQPAAVEPAPVDDLEPSSSPLTLSPGPIMYNVYREAPGDSSSPEAGTQSATPPVPINAAPLAALMYADTEPFEFGRPRCYTVRAVRGTPPNAVLSAPSERLCMTPEDTFPPAAPTGLTALASDGVISLLWEPNGEADLAGYVILRGRAGDATLQPLTAAPVTDVRYEDRDVMAGVRYVYSVKAVDTHEPTPNVSAESNRVDETAR